MSEIRTDDAPESAVCVIEVGHPSGTPADWRSSTQPDLTVCDRHKGHYQTAYDDYGHLEPWVPVR